MNKRVVVLLSGGVDSSTCLALAVRDWGKENILAVSAFYGQKHDVERVAAQKISVYYGVDLTDLQIPGVFKYSNCPLLVGSTEKITHGSYAQQLEEMGGHGIVKTYVPFRNGILLSCATALALGVGASNLYYGAHRDDAVGGAYPDCTRDFVNSMGKAIEHGTGRTCFLTAPFISNNKAEIVKLGLALGVPYELTWSCYEGGVKACGTCGTCIDRKAAFAANGVEDPIAYEV